MRFAKFTLWAAALATLSCAAAQMPPLAEPRPPILGDRTAFEREVGLAPSREVWLPELGISFRVPTAQEVERTSAEYYDAVYFDIGTEAPITCHVYHDRRQLANLLAYHPLQLQGVEQEDALRRVAHVGTGAEAGHAFLTLHWLHAQGGLFGVVKQAASNVYGHTVYCNHPEPGYEESFEQVFRTLLSTFLSNRAVDPYYAEIVAIRIGDRPIGVETMEMRHAQGGRSRIDFSQALLLPRGPATLVATDVHEISFSSGSGDLIRQRVLQVQAGVLATNLVLEATGPGQWSVSGRYKAQAFARSFALDAPLRSSLGAALDMRDSLIRRGRDASLEYWGWLPEDDPGRPSRVSIEVTGLSESGFYTGAQRFGSRQRDLVLDSDGSIVSGAVELGPATMHMERIFVAGAY